MADIFEVEKILADRTRRGKAEYKIRWKTFGPKEDSWEPEENLISCPDVLKEYKKKNGPKLPPTPRRSQRSAPKPVEIDSQTKVVRSETKRTKITSVTVQKPRRSKTALENDFVTPRPPKASIRQRVLELEETAQKTLERLRNKKNLDETDSVNISSSSPRSSPVSPNTQRARNRLQELKAWLDKEKSSSPVVDEGASWWIVALCVLCFVIVLVLILWNDYTSSGKS